MGGTDDQVRVLNRKEQSKLYGIDCGDDIVFSGGSWSPGGEHLKKITVKNVSTETLKFKYELPKTKFFSMEFPKLVTLSPGNSVVLNISFRPVCYANYDDYVLFTVYTVKKGIKVSGGKFKLVVQANIPALQWQIPEEIDFHFCPTNEVTSQEFELSNTGQINALFSWDVVDAGKEHGQPFAVEPKCGEIKAGQRILIKASFSPKSASVFVTPLQCLIQKLDDKDKTEVKQMTLRGIGKYTYLATSESVINFGDQIVGLSSSVRKPTERYIILSNPSLVRASFNISAVETDHDPVFFLSPLRGVIPPNSTLTIKIKYVPISTGEFTCDHFEIKTPGGNVLKIQVTGRAAGPIISLWKKNQASNLIPGNSINFQDVEVGKTVTRVLILRNSTDFIANFNFITADGTTGIFKFERLAGTIQPMLETGISVSFTPTRAGNFYRRIFCLIHNQMPLHVDILGTAFDAKSRPSPFQQAHVDAYRARCTVGLALASPEILEEYMKSNGKKLFLSGALQILKEKVPLQITDEIIKLPSLSSISSSNSSNNPEISSARCFTRSGEALIQDVDFCHEFFVYSNDSSAAIVLKETLLDFGNVSITNVSSKQLLHVTNRTKARVTCIWTTSTAFEVFPTSQDINPGETVEYKVAFHPVLENVYYFSELEAHVSFKSNRTFRLVNEECFTPPWCIQTRVFGSTFSQSNSQFQPKVEFNLTSQRVSFPCCYVGDSVFQTIMISNLGDTPILFCFNHDKDKDTKQSIFSVKPICGIIPAMSFHLVQLRFTPTKSKRYTKILKCRMNNSFSSHTEIELVGVGTVPKVAFDSTDVVYSTNNSNATLYIKPTSVGLETVRTFRLKNITRLPLLFKWNIPAQYQSIVNTHPTLGRLNGNMTSIITTTFCPKTELEYILRVPLQIKSIATAKSSDKTSVLLPIVQTSVIKIQGIGTSGAISFSPSKLTFDTILVNDTYQDKLCILNSSDCDLRYSIQVSVHADTEVDDMGNKGDEVEKYSNSISIAQFLSCSHPKDILPARSHREINITFSPTVSGNFVFIVECYVIKNEEGGTFGNNKNFKEEPLQLGEKLVCQIHARASFPTLVVKDVFSPNIPTNLLWRQLGLVELNAFLARPLTQEELQTNRESSSNFETLRRFRIEFTPSPINDLRERISLLLHNPGELTVAFSIRFPNESEIEIERWADVMKTSKDELQTNIIIDRNIFEVTPRSGTVLPGESILLEVSYAHVSNSDMLDGQHLLPFVFTVAKGKQLVFELSGRTLNSTEPILFIPNRMTGIRLSPVRIGDRHPPIQYTEVFNPGKTPLRYMIEHEGPCEELCQSNYGMKILCCQTPEGFVAPHGSARIKWVFRPMEAKEYSCTFKIQYQGLQHPQYGETYSFTIFGVGFHPDATTLETARGVPIILRPPNFQSISPPNRPLILSQTWWDFGHIPTRCPITRIFVIKNISETEDTSFQWNDSHPMIISGIVQFVPMSGQLGPREHTVVKMILNCDGKKSENDSMISPMVLDEDLECMVFDQSTSGMSYLSNQGMSESSPGLQYSRKNDSRLSKQTSVSSFIFEDGNSSRLSTHSRCSVENRKTRASISFFGQDAKEYLESRNNSSFYSSRGGPRQPKKLNNINSSHTSLFVHIFAQFISQHDYRSLNVVDQSVLLALSSSNVSAVGKQRLSSIDIVGISKRSRKWNVKIQQQCRETVQDILEIFAREIIDSPSVEQPLCNLPLETPVVYFTPTIKTKKMDLLKVKGIEDKKQKSKKLDNVCTLNQPELQTMLSNILENTMFNIVQEIAHGEFNPFKTTSKTSN